MKFSAFKAILLVILLVLVLLSSSSSVDVNECPNSFSNIVENASCTRLVVKPFEQCINVTNTVFECCDVLCTVITCNPKTITEQVNCTTEYKSVNECCEGYSGEECLPVCNNTCAINSYCSAPNTCSCSSGWKGINCNEVSGLKVTQVWSDAVSLSWSLPANVSNINGYYVHIENDQYSFNKSIFDVVNRTKLEGLTPSTSYRACVAPLVVEGEGTSTCLNVQTLSQAPTTPPGDVIVLSVSGTTVISWTPPTQPNGPITMYTVYINNTEGSVSKTIEVEGSITMAQVDGLGSSISVRVSASTTGGEGVVSPYTHHTITLDTSISDVPQPEIDIDAALTLSILTHTSASVSWLPPSPMGEVSFYVLCVSRESSSQPVYIWVLRKNQSLEHVMDTLVQFVPYKLEVFYGSGDVHYRLLHRRAFFTREGVPIQYPIIFGYRSTGTSINVTVEPVSLSDTRGLVLDYTVRYAKAEHSCDYVYDEINRTVSVQSVDTIMLRSVSVSSNYCVAVSVSNKAGEGPLSPFVFIPVLSQSYFTLKFYGFSSCNDWKRNTSELTNILAGVLNRDCSSCIKSDSYFVNPMVHCGDDNQVYYSATIIGTLTHSSSQLVQILMNWSQSDPEVVINGAYLFSTDPGNTLSPSSEPSSDEDMKLTAIIILVVVLILVLIGWAATAIFCVVYHRQPAVGPEDKCSPPPAPGSLDMKIRQSSTDELL